MGQIGTYWDILGHIGTHREGATAQNAPFTYGWPVLVLVAIKLFIQLATIAKYGFHRDEFLYLDEGRHLAWGFLEVPPLTPFVGRLALELGGSLFVVRLFPALIGAISILLVARMVHDMGGDRRAQFLASFAFLVSPAFLGSNHLFQPVSFDQFFWLLAAFWMVRIIRYQRPLAWYAFGATLGLGWLTKYSIAFFGLALSAALVFSPHRWWFRTRHPYLGLLLGGLIALPNLIWQIVHHFPVMAHMKELRENQLSHVDLLDFLIPQFLFHGGGTLVWAAGFVALYRSPALHPYRLLGWAWLLVLALLIALQGKDYYSIGAYPMLMAAGGIAWATWLKPATTWRLGGFLGLMLLISLPLIPFNLPILSLDRMMRYAGTLRREIGLVSPLRWEDGEIRDLPQDYADMLGWEEIPQRVAAVYHALPEEDRSTCVLWGGGYVHAGVLNYYRREYDLPETISLNSSYAIWAPDTLRFNQVILIDDVFQEQSSWFEYSMLVDSIHHPLARDPGFIYYRKTPRIDVEEAWRERAKEAKEKFNF